MLRTVVCVSGGGTNLQAIIDALKSGRIVNTRIVRVISNNPGAYALERAKAAGIEGICVSPKDYENRELFNQALLASLREAEPDLIVLAGFMVAVPACVIDEYRGRIINVHPALIPSFCGKGYYGLHVHERVLERGVKVTGATVHWTDPFAESGRDQRRRYTPDPSETCDGRSGMDPPSQSHIPDRAGKGFHRQSWDHAYP